MARTLSDGLIIAMIEASTRLTAARGSSSRGGSSAPAAKPEAHAEDSAVVTPATTPEAAPTEGTAVKPEASHDHDKSGDGDHRSADEIGSDFATIYRHIEEMVRASAEQETKTVGFSVR